jgi:hypothetical protein
MAEADLLGKRVAAVVNARSSIPPIISLREARRMLNDGQVELDPDENPSEEITQVPPKKPQEPSPIIPPDRLIKPVTRAMGTDEKEMIEALYKFRDEQAKKERKLGEEILKEQDNKEE